MLLIRYIVMSLKLWHNFFCTLESSENDNFVVRMGTMHFIGQGIHNAKLFFWKLDPRLLLIRPEPPHLHNTYRLLNSSVEDYSSSTKCWTRFTVQFDSSWLSRFTAENHSWHLEQQSFWTGLTYEMACLETRVIHQWQTLIMIFASELLWLQPF